MVKGYIPPHIMYRPKPARVVYASVCLFISRFSEIPRFASMESMESKALGYQATLQGMQPNAISSSSNFGGLMKPMSCDIVDGLSLGKPWIYHPLAHYMLVGGLEHFLFSHILGIIIPID